MPQLSLPLVDPGAAPEPARTTLADVQKKYGFVPNLYRAFANAPAALDAYRSVADIFGRTSLTPTERNVVLLAASRENGCEYCVAVHSTVADMQQDSGAVTSAIRDAEPVADRRLEALRRLTQALVWGRGRAEPEVRAFIEAGYRPAQVLEVLVGIMLKTLSNYTNHLVSPPLDAAFAARVWSSAQR